MKRKSDNLLYCDSPTKLDRNISRLMKIAEDSNKPNRAFTESLVNNALYKLKQLKTTTKQDENNITVKVSWWEKVLPLAAMFAVVCLAGLSFLVSQINSVFAVIFLTIMFINRVIYLGGLIL